MDSYGSPTTSGTPAERGLRRLVLLLEAAHGPDDPRLAPALEALGASCAAHGRLAEAERLYLRTIALLEGRRTPDDRRSTDDPPSTGGQRNPDRPDPAGLPEEE
ncbi:tetratricopeptide repeat protein [Kitasatospora sp. NPDC050543]|uniref:tetratricopeptide repeat protein n=1 Tax=Kitasatospora sp. NPDC050543 TaxID=3364054 RepID=UPI003796C798